MLLTITPKLRAVGFPRRLSIRCSVFSPKPSAAWVLERDFGVDQIPQHGKSLGSLAR